MGGMLRCIKNEYSLDQLENEINQTDGDTNFDDIDDTENKKQVSMDDLDKKIFGDDNNNHYADNYLKNTESKRNKTFSYNTKENLKI